MHGQKQQVISFLQALLLINHDSSLAALIWRDG